MRRLPIVVILLALLFLAGPVESQGPKAALKGRSEPTAADAAFFGMPIAVAAAALLLWFLVGLTPVMIAMLRNHPDTAAIAATSLLLGPFCGIGWAIAFIWSVKSINASARYR